MNRVLMVFVFLMACILASGNQYKEDSLKHVYKSLEQDSAKIKILWQLSDNTDNYIKAIEYTQEALDFINDKGIDDMQARAYFKHGANLFLLGSYDEALDYFIESIKIADKQGDQMLKMRTLNNIGTVYDRIGKYDEALEYYIKSMDVYQQMNDDARENESNWLSYLYGNIGCIYLTKNEFTTAETYLLKGLNRCISADNDPVKGVLYNNLGKLYLTTKEFDKAYDYLNKALIFRKNVGNKNDMVKSYFFLGVYYFTIEDYDNAKVSLENGLHLSKEIGTIDWTKWIYKYLYLLHKKQGEVNNALRAHEHFKAASDSLMNEKTISDIARIQMQYEYEKKEQLKDARQQRMRFIYILIISFFIFTTLIIGLLYILAKSRSRRTLLENERLEKDLELKNKELTTNVMYLLKKNEFMNTISNRLLDFKSRLKGDNRQTILEIVNELQTAADEEVWEEFEIRFQQVHNDFFDNLKQVSPELSPSELKICAFLRLNMKTKEIAAITHLSIRTIEVTRSNIRKKLNLTHSDVNLISYLNEL
ncbi:tetratricopeptide repeat protein [Carboxylicivirga sp. RSCT41]|uniref:tetratricopeptide repeat protein n=1 Tax=Carboxylicivirga agarovorans TaxID=3417570 RepID=UPI003D330823